MLNRSASLAMSTSVLKALPISSLPGSALRMHVESRGLASVLKALPGKLDIKRHSPIILYLPYQNILGTVQGTYQGFTLLVRIFQ